MPWRSKKVWIVAMTLAAIVGVCALNVWVGAVPEFKFVVGSIVVVGGGGTAVQAALDGRTAA